MVKELRSSAGPRLWVFGLFVLVAGLALDPGEAHALADDQRTGGSDCLLPTTDDGAEGFEAQIEDAANRDPLPDSTLIVLKEPKPRVLRFDFGQLRDEATSRVRFELGQGSVGRLEPCTSIDADVEPLQNESNSGTWPGGIRIITAQISKDGQFVEIVVMVDPLGAAPGTWKSGVFTNDPRIDRQTAPIDVTLQHHRADWLPWLIAAVAAAMAIAIEHLMAMGRDYKMTPDPERPRIPRLAWIILGVVAVFIVSWPHAWAVSDDRSWASSRGELAELGWGVVRSATVAYPFLMLIALGAAIGWSRLSRPPMPPVDPGEPPPPPQAVPHGEANGLEHVGGGSGPGRSET